MTSSFCANINKSRIQEELLRITGLLIIMAWKSKTFLVLADY